MKQIIIARKDLAMSPGKLAAQVSHGSMAFLSEMIRNPENSGSISIAGDIDGYYADLYFDRQTFKDWFQGSFTKVVCEAKNRNQLLKVVTVAEQLGLKEGKDFFLIKDNCYTELTPEEFDKDGIGRCLTVISFRPLPDDLANQISRKYQLYR